MKPMLQIFHTPLVAQFRGFCAGSTPDYLPCHSSLVQLDAVPHVVALMTMTMIPTLDSSKPREKHCLSKALQSFRPGNFSD